MRKILLCLLVCVLAALAVSGGQSTSEYKPKKGETVWRIVVPGKGTVFIHLNMDKAPKTTKRISELTTQGFYNNQKFYRVVKEPRPFLVQAGDPTSAIKSVDDPTLGSTGSGVKIPYEETGLTNDEGVVGLSTLPKDRDSGDCLFYILLAPSPFLDGKYTIFGKVVQGMDIVKRIEKGDRIESATIVTGTDATR